MFKAYWIYSWYFRFITFILIPFTCLWLQWSLSLCLYKSFLMVLTFLNKPVSFIILWLGHINFKRLIFIQKLWTYFILFFIFFKFMFKVCYRFEFRFFWWVLFFQFFKFGYRVVWCKIILRFYKTFKVF